MDKKLVMDLNRYLIGGLSGNEPFMASCKKWRQGVPLSADLGTKKVVVLSLRSSWSIAEGTCIVCVSGISALLKYKAQK